MPFLLPEQMIPRLHWALQYGVYLFEKSVYAMPVLLLVLVAVIILVALLALLRNELLPLLRAKQGEVGSS